ncbi:hypothetical protein ACWCWD_29555 [Streptomyces sp. NPDC001493]
MQTSLDAALGTLTLADRLELVRRVRVNSLILRDGDRVRAAHRLRGSYLDEDLEDEEGWGAEPADYSVPYDVAAGSLGRVILVRQYVSRFPYIVAFDSGPELSLAEGDVVRVPEQPSEWEREQDERSWHIPEGEFLRGRCSRWIDRVGRPCPQVSSHQGPCGLPARL